jgi:hypothetical protein
VAAIDALKDSQLKKGLRWQDPLSVQKTGSQFPDGSSRISLSLPATADLRRPANKDNTANYHIRAEPRIWLIPGVGSRF